MHSPTLLPALASLALLLPAPATSEVLRFTVDPDHSRVGFQVRHLVSKVPGRFDDFEGTVWLDPDAPEKTLRFDGTVRTASVATNNEKRDGHLRSPEFFDVERFPEMRLVSKEVRREGNRLVATAELTLRGITKEIRLDVGYGGVTTNPFTGTPTTGLELTGTIRRKDFGMKWNKALDAGGFILGDDVQLEIQIEATVTPEEPGS